MAPSTPVATAERVVWGLFYATLAVSLGAVIVFVAGTLATRLPYWGEAEPLFEAMRLRRGLPIFVDPAIGATDLGEPPSRWFVTYPPLWTAVLAIAPSLLLGRILATVAWVIALVFPVVRAPAARRLDAAACAALVGGVWVLANFATVARPDALACALASVALVRAARKGRIDALEAILLASVPFVKPTILGLPIGAFAADLAVRRRSAARLRAVAIGAATAGVLAIGLQLASGGALLRHVLQSNAQPMTLAAWLDHVPSRLPFFAPLFALALWNGWRDRRRSAIAVGALTGALAWVFVALAKTGSASNYWMEPCIAAIVVVAFAAPGAFRIGETGLLHAVAALGYALYVGVASVGASIEHVRDYRADAAFVATLRERCGAAVGDVVAADEAGVELALDGRILTPAYQMAWLVNRGGYSAATWTSDLASPRVRCFVEHSGDLAPAPEVLRFVHDTFERRIEERGFTVGVKRSP